MPASVILTDEKDRPLGRSDTPLTTQAVSPVGALSSLAVAFSSTAEQPVIAASSGKTTSVYRLRLYTKGATDITVRSAMGGAVIEVIPFVAAGALVLDFSDRPYWTTAVGGALTLQSSAAVQVSGRVDYVQG
jgi:hypothetical protein